MAKPQKSAPAAKTSSDKPGAFENLTGWKADGMVWLGLYIAMAVIFYPLFFFGQRLSLTPDAIAAESLYRATQHVTQFGLPLWNPFLYGGMPLFAGYQYGLLVNPIWYVGKIFGFLFGGDAAVMFIYMWLGAIGVYYAVRELGESRGLGLVAGLAWLWMPALMVLPDVGHGSKLMSSAMIPWLLWGSMRVVKNKGWHHVGILALLVGLSVLSLHTQITYYGILLVGIVGVWTLFNAIRDKKILDGALNIGKLILAGVVGGGISAVLALPVLGFASASSRGAAAGGVDWDYATQWSFHPLESITFVWPTFFGSGGQTYWGYMPFTDMPLTFGIVAVLGAALAVWLKRDRWTWLLLAIAIVAWMVSWGKFLPILFKPFFEMLPMFKKFRVPSLILILTQLGMIVLAARGYGEAFRRFELGKEETVAKFKKVMLVGAILFVAFLVLGSMMSGGMKSGFMKNIMANNPGVVEQQLTGAADEMWSVAFTGGLISFILLAGLCGLLYQMAKGSVKAPIFIAAALLATAVEFLPIIYNSHRPLVNFTDAGEWDNYFAPTKRIEFLKQQPGQFRVLPHDRTRSINWWSSFGLQNADGYTGVRLASWDAFAKSEARSGIQAWKAGVIPPAWRAMNIKYLAAETPLPTPLLKEVVHDNDGYLYEILGALPRTYFTKQIETVPSLDAALQRMAKPEWDPAMTALVEEKSPQHTPDSTATAMLEKWEPQHITVKTHRASPGVLVLAEVHAPHWQVKVNGQLKEGLIVDGVLRGVEVPAGDATVEWTYHEDKVFYKGLWITLASTLVALAFVVIGILTGRKNS